MAMLQVALPVALICGLLAIGAMTAGTRWTFTVTTGIAVWVGGIAVLTLRNDVLPPSAVDLLAQALFWYSLPSATLFVFPFLVGRLFMTAYRRVRR